MDQLEVTATVTAYKIAHLLREAFKTEPQAVQNSGVHAVMRHVNRIFYGSENVILEGAGLTRVVEEPAPTVNKYEGDPQE